MKIAWVYVTGFVGALLGAFLAVFYLMQSNLFDAASRNLDPWGFPVAAAALVGLACGTLGIVIEDRRLALVGLLVALAGVVYTGAVYILVAASL
jgi:Ni/Fe-hydrogenase subunit HybB-like protein